jgi:Rrf2 family iron-sulfur cluster assembly transcriptional regulator
MLGAIGMQITTATRYGLRALFDITYHGATRPVRIREISKRQKISPRYLEQILHKLLISGLVASKRGPQGGYVLAADPAQISVADVIDAVQEPVVALDCLNHDEECGSSCDLYDNCVTRIIWKETRTRLQSYFDSVTLADLCDIAKERGLKRESSYSYTYYI